MNSIILYLNPANNELKIEILDQNLDLSNYIYEISDAIGRKVNLEVSNVNSIKINISELSPGIYFLTAKRNNERIGTRSFI